MSIQTRIRNVSLESPTGRGIRIVTGPVSVAAAGPIDLMGAPMTFAPNAEIYGEGEPADYLYKIVRGTVRTSRLLADGRRQIGAVHLPGDIFGLEGNGEHAMSAEAIAETRILVVERDALLALAVRDRKVAQELWSLISRELARVQDHMLLLVKTAQERVAGFLLEMADRSTAGDAIELPMSRRDIADYLGLTVETVCRTLGSLEKEAAIALPTSRRIVLRNRPALREMNG